MKPKLVRLSTVPVSLNILLKGQLRFLNQYFDVVAVSGAGKDLESVEVREGVRVHPIEIKRNISLLNDIISLFQLFLFFKREKPQIVHSITPKAGLLSMLAAKFAGVPIRIHTFTGLIFPSRKGGIQKILIYMDRLLCMCATHIYPEGRGVKEDLIKYKITRKPLKVIANGNVNGINTNYFSHQQISEESKQNLKTELGIQENDFVYIFVGRLVGDKGINELVEAFKKIQNHNIKLLLVGAEERELDPLLQKTIEEIGINDNILAVGYQKDVRPYFAIADALVFPSYREGFPNVVMQAGAMGLPSIVSDINGCNEIIINYKNGIIIHPKNTEALQSAMEQLVNDNQLYNQLKSQSRKMIESRYQQRLVWNELLANYQELLNGIQ
ncbi:glycosyltransferase family 4 protein [Riemerella columbina]|uniref:glycosyltransferase family 4 protein n=1 Tax=Riemerella columbina TaxID=103810 RepID=UPI000372C83F|nr:glycosyltransferase family 4 protein [Riemerella columbina]